MKRGIERALSKRYIDSMNPINVQYKHQYWLTLRRNINHHTSCAKLNIVAQHPCSQIEGQRPCLVVLDILVTFPTNFRVSSFNEGMTFFGVIIEC
jgi:hypothetical protein